MSLTIKSIQWCLCLCWVMSTHPFFGQVPFAGLYQVEIPIPSTLAATIDAELPLGGPSLPRCYRIYICMSEPNWELQAIYGGDGFPAWSMNTSTQFYQNNFGSHLGSGISSALFGLLPALQFDSWFTINAFDNTAPVNLLSFQSVPQAFTIWETTGANFNSGTSFGAAISNLPSYPNTSGMPDSFNRILIAQITTDGTFNGSFNLQFRKMNANGTPFVPATVVQINNAVIDSQNPIATPCALILPVSLKSFFGEQLDSKVQLTWMTATEINNDHFVVQRSPDNITWTNIGVILGYGNSSEEMIYQFMDEYPLSGDNYYRLLQVDTNGENEISATLHFEFETRSNADFLIYPNPCDQDEFKIMGDVSDIEKIELTDIAGNYISEYRVMGNPICKLNTAMNSGTYIICITTKKGSISHHRLVVQR